jgi:hypothetical protein
MEVLSAYKAAKSGLGLLEHGGKNVLHRTSLLESTLLLRAETGLICRGNHGLNRSGHRQRETR